MRPLTPERPMSVPRGKGNTHPALKPTLTTYIHIQLYTYELHLVSHASCWRAVAQKAGKSCPEFRTAVADLQLSTSRPGFGNPPFTSQRRSLRPTAPRSLQPLPPLQHPSRPRSRSRRPPQSTPCWPWSCCPSSPAAQRPLLRRQRPPPAGTGGLVQDSPHPHAPSVLLLAHQRPVHVVRRQG